MISRDRLESIDETMRRYASHNHYDVHILIAIVKDLLAERRGLIDRGDGFKKSSATWQSNYQKLKNMVEQHIEKGKGEMMEQGK